MYTTARTLIFTAMALMTVVSIWTTYVSLYDSILPAPTVPLNFGTGAVWRASLPALGLSLAIGLMLFGLKMAIMFEHKKLNIMGLSGLLIVAFISITFNMDVLYRTADKEFFIQYSDEHMRSAYQDYLGQVQRKLVARREAIRMKIAVQEGEFDAEVQGLRTAPAGFGPRAKQEAYRLSLLRRTIPIELESVEAALAATDRTDALLVAPPARSLAAVAALQSRIRVAAKDAGSPVDVSLPAPVRLESPLFTVIAKLFDFGSVGLKELFFLAIAVFLDLGDIIGYSLVPDRRTPARRRQWLRLPAAEPTPVASAAAPVMNSPPALAVAPANSG